MKSGILLCGFVLLLGAAGCVPQNVYYSATEQKTGPTLVVQAESTVEAEPDQLELRLGVVTRGDDAEQTLQRNNRRMASVMEHLRELGIKQDEMETGQFQIRPEWSVPPRPTPANWKREIVGYQVSNELRIATKQVDLAGDLLSLAQRAGANQIGQLQFALADPEEQHLIAIDRATRKALRKARTLAQSAGAGLGEIVSLTLDNSDGRGGPQVMFAEAKLASDDSVPVATGKVEIKATVTVTYRLTDNDSGN